MPPGSLDHNPPKLFDDTVHYLVVGKTLAYVYKSRESAMTTQQIADQLRRIANHLEQQGGTSDD